jgi:DNA recombination protein RmuC
LNIELAVAAVCAAIIGFVLAWIIRAARAVGAEAAYTSRLQTLQREHEQGLQEIRELKTAHVELQEKHLRESTARSAAEAIAQRVPELEQRNSEQLKAQELEHDELTRLSRAEAETSQSLRSTKEQLQNVLSERDASLTKAEGLARQLSDASERRAAFEAEAARIPGLESRLETSQRLVESVSTELSNIKEALSKTHAELLAEREALSRVRDDLKSSREQHEEASSLISRLIVEKTDLTARLNAERDQGQEKIQLLTDAKRELTDQFKALAGEILEEKSRKFTEQNQVNLGQLLDPLKTKLTEFQAKVDDVYVKDTTDRTALREQVKQLIALNNTLSEDAKNLTHALKGSSKTQGTWGELVLERLLESSGLRKGEEYQVQSALIREDGSRAQPDVIIRLPEERNLVVDAKVSLSHYETFSSSDDEQQRSAALQGHLSSVRTHIKGLSAKNYQSLYELKSLDFVLMFVPIEPAFMLAVQHDRQLFMDAWEKNVLLVSPSTFLFVVRTVAHLWRQEAQSRNAQDIANRGAELYDRLCGFVADLEKLGDRLRQAQDSYADAHAKLTRNKGNVIWQAGKLKELGVKPTRNLPAPLVEASEGVEHEVVSLVTPGAVSEGSSTVHTATILSHPTIQHHTPGQEADSA